MKREGEEGRGGNMCTLGICLFVGVCEGESTSKEGKTEDQKAVFFFTTKRSRGEKWAVTISRTSNTGPLRYYAIPTPPKYHTNPFTIHSQVSYQRPGGTQAYYTFQVQYSTQSHKQYRTQAPESTRVILLLFTSASWHKDTQTITTLTTLFSLTFQATYLILTRDSTQVQVQTCCAISHYVYQPGHWQARLW